MELPRIYKCPELADRIEALIAAHESGNHVEEVGALNDIKYRFIELPAAVSHEWIDQA